MKSGEGRTRKTNHQAGARPAEAPFSHRQTQCQKNGKKTREITCNEQSVEPEHKNTPPRESPPDVRGEISRQTCSPIVRPEESARQGMQVRTNRTMRQPRCKGFRNPPIRGGLKEDTSSHPVTGARALYHHPGRTAPPYSYLSEEHIYFKYGQKNS